MAKIDPPRPDTRRIRTEIRDDLGGRRILIVEPSGDLPNTLNNLAGGAVTIARFSSLTADLLMTTAPEVVLSPLMTSDHDILDLAKRLEELGFKGALRAFCAPLPNARVILTEVRQIWPEGDFDILEVHPRPD
ncbi:hypothetical protein OE699_05850 [Sedimentimonas flavescens]|uniref:Uncharacterized protein n=1 Tax=Sedimentimonas flavescens TaxID=2851012 RepID=A0ABT2ZX97_9RHOB|nr:hypothetical protein [Sedimentimonas flavescens]MCV2878371.1 hypothetical protein [Sedimentimonas flavescens]